MLIAVVGDAVMFDTELSQGPESPLNITGTRQTHD